MFIENSFGKTMEILHRSMNVSLLRRDVIANNIANAETPNFKRSTVNFEAELKRALDSESAGAGRMPGALTDQRHIAFDKPQDWREVRPRRVLDYLTTSKNNGNNVDVEEEMMTSLQNQLNYQMMTRSISNQFTQIGMVVR